MTKKLRIGTRVAINNIPGIWRYQGRVKYTAQCHLAPVDAAAKGYLAHWGDATMCSHRETLTPLPTQEETLT